jgi:hypothetical protein
LGRGRGSGGDSSGFTWTPLVPLGPTWSHLVPPGLTLSYMVSTVFSWSHLVSIGLTWSTQLATLGLTCITLPHMVSHGLTWSHMVPLVSFSPNRSHLASLNLTWSHPVSILLVHPPSQKLGRGLGRSLRGVGSGSGPQKACRGHGPTSTQFLFCFRFALGPCYLYIYREGEILTLYITSHIMRYMLMRVAERRACCRRPGRAPRFSDAHSCGNRGPHFLTR